MAISAVQIWICKALAEEHQRPFLLLVVELHAAEKAFHPGLCELEEKDHFVTTYPAAVGKFTPFYNPVVGVLLQAGHEVHRSLGQFREPLIIRVAAIFLPKPPSPSQISRNDLA
jgi:hypothetical protein